MDVPDTGLGGDCGAPGTGESEGMRAGWGPGGGCPGAGPAGDVAGGGGNTGGGPLGGGGDADVRSGPTATPASTYFARRRPPAADSLTRPGPAGTRRSATHEARAEAEQVRRVSKSSANGNVPSAVITEPLVIWAV